MATPANNWRDLITPSSRAKAAQLQKHLIARAATQPSDLPADLSPSDMSEISIARSLNPSVTIEEILGPRPRQARLELHMTGQGVEGHGVDADCFSTFLSRFGDALAITARSLARRSHRASQFVFAAVEPGSLTFELQARDLPTRHDEELPVPVDSSSVDSDALRAVTAALTNSATGADEALNSAISALPRDARAKLYKAMEQVAKAGWTIDGSLRQTDFTPVALRLPLEATGRLRRALEAKSESLEQRVIDAEISGFRREEGLIWLQPMNGEPRFPAAASTHEVLREARRAGAIDGTIVRAHVRIETRAPKGGAATLKISRTITELEITAVPERLPLDQSRDQATMRGET